MSCGHCVSAVTEEISKIGGVQQVDIDLETGHVLVTSESTLPPDTIKDAVDDAGYALA
jgi:copper chaperone CopZ